MPLSTAEAARILGIQQISVGHSIRRGSLKAIRLGREYMIRKEDLDEYIRFHARAFAARGTLGVSR